MNRPYTAIALGCFAMLTCSKASYAQLEWPVSVKFVYDGNGMPPGNDPDCMDQSDGSAISCEVEVLDKIEYANQILAKHHRGYAFDIVEILHWTNPPPPNVLVCIGGKDNGKMCIPNGPEACACASDCCYANGTPGCDDVICQAVVCETDPFCCNTSWDGICADEAADLCGGLCSVCADGDWEQAPYLDWATFPGGNSHVLLGCLGRADSDEDGDGLSDTYLWREGALNTYIINLGGGGVCGPKRCHDRDIPATVIGQGADGANVRPLHEFAHCLGLCHTHGCSWDDCCHDASQEGAPASGDCSDPVVGLGEDCLADTLPDNQTCETLEGLVQANYPDNLGAPMYEDLTCEERQAVITTLYNVISYHMDDDDDRMCDGTEPLIQCDCSQPSPYGCPASALDPMRCRHRLSSDQLDLMTDRSNAHAGGQLDTGCTRFVDAAANPADLVGIPSCGDLNNVPKDGSSLHPYVSVIDGLLAADPEDIVLIRAGSYDQAIIINQSVVLRASRGPAVIGSSGP